MEGLMNKMTVKSKSDESNDQKILDMYHELDSKGQAEIMSKLEEMCGYYDEQGNDDSEGSGDVGDMSGKPGVTVVIAKGK